MVLALLQLEPGPIHFRRDSGQSMFQFPFLGLQRMNGRHLNHVVECAQLLIAIITMISFSLYLLNVLKVVG